MKRLHWLILKSFFGPFIATFSIAMVFLIMQFLWKYIDDLMGKGLEFSIVMELLWYASADLIPMALPLALLLSSIMVLGKFGEENELTAMKSSGMSLFRILYPLIIMVGVMSIGAFLFSNYTWPSAHFQMRVLINDIQTKKTTLLIKENEYYDEIDGYSIKVKKKLDDSHFEDIFIADHNGENSYKWREIYAKKADMKKSADGAFLILTLYDGFSDEELQPNAISIGNFPFRHTDFKRLKLTMDLSQFQFDRTESDSYQESVYFKSYHQLTEDLDSMNAEFDHKKQIARGKFKEKMFLFRDSSGIQIDTLQSRLLNLNTLDPTIKGALLGQAINTIRRTKEEIRLYRDVILHPYNEMIIHVNIARYRIFNLSVALILLFFIGAPLGAIVKKGGLGYPVVIAIVLFITYYMLSITGEKLAKVETLDTFWGMWLSSLILLPIAVFLTVKSNSDSALFNKEFYTRLFTRKRKK